MKILILGLGISGKAAAEYLRKKGDEVIGIDQSVKSCEGINVFSTLDISYLKGIDYVVKSPGIAHTHPWVEAVRSKNIPIVGEIDLALAALQKKQKRIFGITGSNGKTTTTLLTAHLLNMAGNKAIAAGNVGVPLIEQIDKDVDTFVVELSSFQLESIVASPVLDSAAILNITPNHLDRHLSFKDYCCAKMRIATCLRSHAICYTSKQTSQFCDFPHKIFDLEKEKVETICSLSYRDSLYPHDWENVLAAYTLTRVQDNILKKGIETFIRPPHRLELVNNRSGVTYVNDSKATSIDAVIKALQAIRTPILLIAGGVDKGGSFEDWLPYCKSKVVCVFALGQAAARIKRELSPDVKVEEISSLQEALNKASKMAKKGDTVLLSPGCSSYDQFNNYQERGETFRKIVEELVRECL